MHALPILLLVAGLTLTAASARAVETGARMPVPANAQRIDGSPLDWPTHTRGKVVYVDFWASWCVPCRLSFPALNALQEKYGAQGFAVVGINQDVAAEDAQRFARKVPVTFALLADPGNTLAKAYAVKAMPSGYLVDRRGMVRHVHRGFTTDTAAGIEKEVAALLREAP